MLARGCCRSCRPDYRRATREVGGVYKNDAGKWCCKCDGCNAEQAYTRVDHARQSAEQGWMCRKCAAAAKRFANNRPIGDRARVFNRFRKAAADRGIAWGLTEVDMFSSYDGVCAMTGWPISLAYGSQTASLDRVDSARGYEPGNIQWVHVMVNMCKNKYSQADFVRMCVDVAKTAGGGSVK